MVCGSPVVASANLLRRLAGECDHVIAVDRGLDALLGAGLGCDVYVGDVDTVSDAGRALVDAATDFEVERHDPYKDLYRSGAGARLRPQSLAGCRSSCDLRHRRPPGYGAFRTGLLAGYGDAPIWIAEDKVVARILRASESWTIEGAEGKTFSIIAIAPGTVVSEHGLEWELDHAPLACWPTRASATSSGQQPRSKSTPAPPSLTSTGKVYCIRVLSGRWIEISARRVIISAPSQENP